MMGKSDLFLMRTKNGELWTPASPTTDGGLSPHTWHNPDVALFQDVALTIPAVADNDPIRGSTSHGTDAHSVIQAGAGAALTLKLNILNGLSVMRCDGGDWLQAVFVGGAIAQPFTVFCVAKSSVAGDGISRNIIDGDDAGNRMILGAHSSNTWRIYAGTQLLGGATSNDWIIWTVLFNGVSSQFWHNGVSQASGNAGAGTPDGLTICAGFSGAQAWIGDKRELLIYPGNLSNPDKNQVAGYLSRITGISYTDI